MTDLIIAWIAWGGYFGIFLLMAIENIIPPIPSEVIMGLGGIAVARGEMAMGPLILWGTAGTTVGNLFWYAIGRWYGYRRLRPFVDRWGRWLTLEWEDVENLQRFFVKHGGWLVFAVRFTPTFRTLISLPAGMARMGLPRFVVATFLGAGIWNVILAYAGYILGTRFAELDRYVGPVGIALTVAAIGYWMFRFTTWKPRAKRGS